MKSNVKANLDSLQLSDVYSLMFFLLYKLQDTPEYATLSEMCYLLDAGNMTRLLTYFAGKTITIPKQEEFVILVNALLLYQRVHIKGESLVDAQAKATKKLTAKQREQVQEMYLKIIPIISQYNIDRSQLNKYERSR